MVAGIDGCTAPMLSCPLTSEFGGSIWEAAEQHDAFGALAGAGTPLSIDARWLVQTPEPGGARERAESGETDAEVTGGDEAGGESQRTALTRYCQRTVRHRCGTCSGIRGGQESGNPGSHLIYRCTRRRRLAIWANMGRVRRGSDLGLGFQ